MATLSTPQRIGTLTTRNRIVSLPHGNSYGLGGIPSASHVAYLRHIAGTAAGLVVIGATAVHPTTYRPPLFSLFDDRALPRLREMTGAVHSANGLIVSQLGHSGRQVPVLYPGLAAWAPSPSPAGPQGDLLGAIDSAGLGEIRDAFVGAARRALAAGFDGVEVHAAHSYLMQQFLSPFYNRRTDEYGGGLANRLRLLAETLELLRTVTRDRLLGIRLGAGDEREGGLEWPEVLEAARTLSERGLFDYVSLAAPAPKGRYIKDESFPRGGLRDRTAALKAAIGVPVIISQRIDTPMLANEILAAGEADLIGLARELVADPDWGVKAAAGHADRIRPCVACLENCRRTSDAAETGTVSCSVNPTAYGVMPALPVTAATRTARRIVIVGGGPAGCEAALVAAADRVAVTLFERSDRLGGAARLAGRAPFRAMWLRYADALEAMLRAVPGLELRLGTEATEAAVRALAPDVIVLATGAVMTRPPAADLSTYELLALARPPAWPRAAVVDTYGRWDGVNAVEMLAAAGSSVTYVTALERAAANVPEESREGVLARLARAGVDVITGATLTIAGGESYVAGRFVPRRATGRFDGIVAAGELGAHLPSPAWSPDPAPVWRIGDCLSPRGVSLATREGWLVGSRLR